MNSEIEHIFSHLTTEKHYVPNTISVLGKERNTLNVTAGQNANWTYANFFILDEDSPIQKFSINEGQYVVAKRNGEWGIWDWTQHAVARGIDEIETFVKKSSAAEAERQRMLNPKETKSAIAHTEPLQVIYYGAPGTGKSYTIDDMTDENNSVRTTFHPDTDYSTFVGAYKPTMQPMPIHAFVGTTVHRAKDAAGTEATERKIVYKYVPQAFLKAYVAAWRNLDAPYYLIIEEINRGNCAQIFGDLFQLLDRNNSGSSAYAIHADEDIAQFLGEDPKGFAGLTPEEREAIAAFKLEKDNGDSVAIGADILSGKKLLLPPNLRIWATMNTSDQSLFPIDSAFKRRWNWRYVPINVHSVDKQGNTIEWQFKVGDKRYKWADFLEFINPKIYKITLSSDKQMGYFFAKPDDITDKNLISESTFLNKVLFYLWTDVLKDYDIADDKFKDKETGETYLFSDFFKFPERLIAFVDGLGLTPVEDEDNTPAGVVNDRLSVTFPDGETINTGKQVDIYINSLRKIGLERAAEFFAQKGYKLPLIAKEPVETTDSARRYNEADGWYILCGPDTYPYYPKLEMLNNELSLGLDIKHK